MKKKKNAVGDALPFHPRVTTAKSRKPGLFLTGAEYGASLKYRDAVGDEWFVLDFNKSGQASRTYFIGPRSGLQLDARGRLKVPR